MVCGFAVLVLGGLLALIVPGELMHLSYARERVAYRDAPESLEPSRAGIVMTRVGGVLLLLFAGYLGFLIWS